MDISGHILIIDDETALRHTLARVLQQAGHEVTTAASGSEALALLEQQRFDLVYLDIRMPDMNGLEALKAIHAGFPELPVVLFTAQPDLNSVIEALRQGAADYLLKPLKPQTLLDRTRDILSRRENERRKQEIQAQIDALQSELNNMGNNQDPPSEIDPRTVESKARFIKCGKLSLDLHTRRLSIEERLIALPPATFDYLLVLARHAPNVVDCQTLVAEAQGYQANAREAQELVKWHIHHIRQAIEPDPRNPVYLINVRGAGYRLVTD